MTNTTDTSREAYAAAQRRAGATEAAIVKALEFGDFTTDEVAKMTGIDRLTIRPRMAIMRGEDKVEDSGERRANKSGKNAIVWRLAL